MTNGNLAIPIAQMALLFATPVAFLKELDNPGTMLALFVNYVTVYSNNPTEG